jgi:hypothetical protein
MFTDEVRGNVWNEVRQRGFRPFANLLTDQMLAEAALGAGLRLGRSALTLPTMVWLGLSSALHTSKNFADILVITFKWLHDLQIAQGKEGVSGRGKKSGRQRKRNGQSSPKSRKNSKRSKHHPRGSHPEQVSEEAFVQARQRMPLAYWTHLLLTLVTRFRTQHEELTRWRGFRLLALDGSDIALPCYQPLQEYFGTCQNGKQARTVQARLVMLAFAQVRLPYRYELVPQSCHEQTAAARLLQRLEPNDLVLIDRGFWSFGLFWQIQQQQAFFGIRLRRRVKLKRLRQLGPKDWLVRWTPAKRSKKQCSWASLHLPASIDLRLIEYHLHGFQPSAVVTSVLDPQVLSRNDWVQMAVQDKAGQTLHAGLYHRRWEIETMFYELKLTQQMEGGLRSRTPRGIEYEVAGHVLLHFLTRWLMVKAALEHGLDPLRLSFTHALRELEDLRPLLLIADSRATAERLLLLLYQRIAQHQVPLRPGRHYPRPSDTYLKGKYRLSSKQLKCKA